MEFGRFLAALLFVVALPVLMMTTAVRFAANEERVYDYSVTQYDAAAISGIDEAQLKSANRQIIRYWNNDQEVLNIRVTVNGQEQPLFSPREVRHMRDVKNVFRALFRANEVSLAFVLLYVVGVFIWAREAPIRALAGQALIGSAVSILLVLVLGGVAMAGFQGAWNQFHTVLFSNDFWQLDPARDHLIQMFPEEFWFDVSLLVGAFILGEALLLGLASVMYLGIAHRRQAKRLALAQKQVAEG